MNRRKEYYLSTNNPEKVNECAKVEIYCNQGGINYFNYKNEQKGIYLSFGIVEKTETCEVSSPLSETSFKILLNPLKRFSKKQFDNAVAFVEQYKDEIFNIYLDPQQSNQKLFDIIARYELFFQKEITFVIKQDPAGSPELQSVVAFSLKEKAEEEGQVVYYEIDSAGVLRRNTAIVNFVKQCETVENRTKENALREKLSGLYPQAKFLAKAFI